MQPIARKNFLINPEFNGNLEHAQKIMKFHERDTRINDPQPLYHFGGCDIFAGFTHSVNSPSKIFNGRVAVKYSSVLAAQVRTRRRMTMRNAAATTKPTVPSPVRT